MTFVKMRLTLFLVFTAVAAIAYGQGFYNLSFKDIAGNTVGMHSFINRKILFCIVPLAAADSTFQQLRWFRQRYGDSVQVIGIPSLDDGFSISSTAALQSLYNGTGVLLTEGMHTKKSSPNQSALFRWLTHKSSNQHYDIDAQGTGSKFFVSMKGRLFAVLLPQTPLQSAIVDRAVQCAVQ